VRSPERAHKEERGKRGGSEERRRKKRCGRTVMQTRMPVSLAPYKCPRASGWLAPFCPPGSSGVVLRGP
jgi:hypothetical protein